MKRWLAFALLLPSLLSAQARERPVVRVPPPSGFRVFFITDMEGMASVVFNREIISGFEGERYRGTDSPDYWRFYRDLFTREVNAAIAGARRGGARSFVVNEGHGGNLFANLLPWDLDTAALLVRGYPKPMIMTSGLDSSADAVMFIGAHANAGTPGVIAHTYAFDRFTVNGRVLNETGINALVAGEYGVPVVLVSGDDEVVRQAREQLGDRVVTVTTKIALGRSSAITHSPAVVRQMLRDSAAVAVQRALRGEFRPFTMERPYQVEFVVRRSFAPAILAAVDTVATRWNLERTGERTYRYTAHDARDIALLLDAIELAVLR